MNILERLQLLEMVVGINERNYSQIKSNSDSVRNILRSLKSKITQNEYGTLEICELINSKLIRFNIEFQISNNSQFSINSTYEEVGIHYASLDSNGAITIWVFDNLYDYLYEDSYEHFCNIIHSIVIHEFTHFQQLEKAKGYFDDPNIDSNIKYLERVQEIQAHANQAMDKMLDLGYSEKEIRDLLRSPKISKIVPEEVDPFWKYYDIFHGDKSIWNKFLKYCYQYLDSL